MKSPTTPRPCLTLSILLLVSVACWDLGLLATGPAAPGPQWRSIPKIGKDILTRPKFTDEDEGRMAQANARKFDQEHKMWPDLLLETYVTGIAQKLAAVAEPRPFPYRVRVVNEASVNAFTFGGGLLYVHAGLIARMENEAQLAMILGHEIGHVTQRHVTKGIEAAAGTQLLGEAATAVGTATGALPRGSTMDAVYDLTMKASINGYGRSHEREADRVGLEYMVRAGYDPREGPICFELLLKEHGDAPRLVTFFFGSHPNNVDRYETTSGIVKDKYAAPLADRRLVVNTEEFKRATRRVAIAAGRLDYEDHRYQTARAMFEKAVRAWQDDPEPHYYLGKIELETGGGPEAVARAIAHLTEAVRAADTFAPAHRELGVAHYRAGERPKAVTSLERYLALDPNATDAAEIRATINELRR